MKYAAIVLVGLGLLACNDSSSSSGACTDNRDCAGAQLCLQGVCRLECEHRTDCAQGQLCVDHQCRSPNDRCVAVGDCEPFGLTCDVRQGRCVLPDGESCGAARPCPEGLVCAGGACVVPTGDAGPERDQGLPTWDSGATDAAPGDASVPTPDAAGPAPDAAGPVPDAAGPAPDQGPPPQGTKQYGESCRCPSECESGLCLSDPYDPGATEGTCTKLCDGDATCPRLDRCVRAQAPADKPRCPPVANGPEPGEIVQICAPNETGRPCDGPGDCLIDGVCVTPPNPIPGVVPVQSACGARCDNNAKCPPGFHCGQVPAQGGGHIRACVSDVTTINTCPDGDFRVCGGTCRVPAGFNEADITFCIGWTPNGAPGFCSCTCATGADCPTGFACSPIPGFDSGDARRPKICLPMSGYTCPGGGFQSCLSQTCAGQAEGEAFDRCAAPCGGPNDCPQGHVCQAFGAQGSFCVPLL